MTPTTGQSNDQKNGHKDTPTGASAALSSPLVAALEQVWAAIQHRHPEIPDVVIVVASGSVGAPRGALKLGHFAAMRWTHATTGSAEGTTAGPSLPEVFVGGEGLALGVVDVLGTLLHEATHALAHVRGIQDTSRQGRYHNRKFRDLAQAMGLEVRDVPVIGWSDTHVPATTVTGYAPVLERLHLAMTIHRRAEGTLTTPAPGDDAATGTTTTGGKDVTGAGSRNGAAARCGCGRRIRVTASVLALGPITCGICGQPFTTPSNDPAQADEVDEIDEDKAEVDEAGSASRQHYIDTGHYLDTDGRCACDEQEAAS
ncbi:hypothetical protein [Kineosporia sp. A_224]|uniref:hypothetical protein n=1 Tax=Kineosporia sp. A_224 TaxID=1962180 RepID=UPI0018E9B6EE|nr:hypothetical protein [Kineosporia sp. A_224]